jgi:hypothetical protein
MKITRKKRESEFSLTNLPTPALAVDSEPDPLMRLAVRQADDDEVGEPAADHRRPDQQHHPH